MEKIMCQTDFKSVRVIKYLFVFLILINFSCDNYLYNDKDLQNILGVKVTIENHLYSYEEASGSQGEGYLFNKYRLSKATISNFVKLKNKDYYPKKDKFKKEWSLITWRNDYSFNKNILDLLTVFEQHNNRKLLNQLLDFKKKLKKEGNYYSIFYKDSIEEPYAVEIYVLEPESKTLWIINIVT